MAKRGGRAAIWMRGGPGYTYALSGTFSADAVADAEHIEISMIGGVTSEILNENFETGRRELLTAPRAAVLLPTIVNRGATLAEPTSQMCTAGQMGEPDYFRWCHRLGLTPALHRKQWEHVFICRALEYHGALRPGSRGIGFGVGTEPMPSLFAAEGCHIMATDLPCDDERAQVWNHTGQLGADLRRLHVSSLCDEDSFYRRVSFRSVDMNRIPPDLSSFDFAWSSCALEHLGSIKAGATFFENSLDCLKPGGLAVHTTEFNLSSNTDTLDHHATVIFRRRDIEALARRLISKGHEVFPITFDCGETGPDRVIDMPPYCADSHLRLALLRWVATSFGMVVRKKA
jgi:hypothetical protein